MTAKDENRNFKKNQKINLKFLKILKTLQHPTPYSTHF